MGITSVESLWLNAVKTRNGGEELWFVKVRLDFEVCQGFMYQVLLSVF